MRYAFREAIVILVQHRDLLGQSIDIANGVSKGVLAVPARIGACL